MYLEQAMENYIIKISLQLQKEKQLIHKTGQKQQHIYAIQQTGQNM